MRCNKCNVDISENTKKCPLCGEKTVDDAPVLENIKTAYYPKVEYKNAPFNFNLLFFGIWAVITGFTLVFDLIKGTGDYTATLITLTAIPFLWTLIIRPLYTKYYYVGRLVVPNCIFLSALLTVLSLKFFTSVEPALSYVIPIVLSLGILILLISGVSVKKNINRVPVFIIMLGAIALLAGIVGIFISGVKFYVYSVPVSLAVFSVVLLWTIKPGLVADEIRARFHF